MTQLAHRTTVYLEPRLHKTLRLKAIETDRSLSDLINEAVQISFSEDEEDLRAFDERKNDKLITFAQALKELKKNGIL